jgi:hypothetical protein
MWLKHRDRAPGASTGPASHGHPALRGISYGADTTRISNFSPTLRVYDRKRRVLDMRWCLDLLGPFASTVARRDDTLGSASEPAGRRLPWVKDILQSRRVT